MLRRRLLGMPHVDTAGWPRMVMVTNVAWAISAAVINLGWAWGMVQAVRAKSAARARIAESTAPRLHHVQIAIPPSREDEARRFYGELLGLRELPKPKNLAGRGGVWFKLGEHELHLGVQEDFAPALKAHPAVMLGDLLSVRARLDAAGATTSEDEPLPGYDRCYVNDPFGNRVELLQPKS